MHLCAFSYRFVWETILLLYSSMYFQQKFDFDSVNYKYWSFCKNWFDKIAWMKERYFAIDHLVKFSNKTISRWCNKKTNVILWSFFHWCHGWYLTVVDSMLCLSFVYMIIRAYKVFLIFAFIRVPRYKRKKTIHPKLTKYFGRSDIRKRNTQVSRNF